MVNQVMQTLSESDATYLKANMGWIMPSLCELIRSNDEEVNILHFFTWVNMSLPPSLFFIFCLRDISSLQGSSGFTSDNDTQVVSSPNGANRQRTVALKQ